MRPGVQCVKICGRTLMLVLLADNWDTHATVRQLAEKLWSSKYAMICHNHI